MLNWNLSERFDYEGHAVAWGVIGEGPAAVVMHGSPFSSLEWRRVAPWLARRRRIFYYDMIGFGRSAKPDTDVLHGMQNGLFAALVRYWRIERPDVVAHDFGGSAALRAHVLNKIDYRSLVLIDPVAISPRARRWCKQPSSIRTCSPACPPTSSKPFYRRTSAPRQSVG
jgi:pimeloyl-ACP methyl ester carboxylesterase